MTASPKEEKAHLEIKSGEESSTSQRLLTFTKSATVSSAPPPFTLMQKFNPRVSRALGCNGLSGETIQSGRQHKTGPSILLTTGGDSRETNTGWATIDANSPTGVWA